MDEMPFSMRAGWASRELVVDEPVYLSGYAFRTQRSRGCYMSLRIGAMYLTCGSGQVLLLPMDLGHVRAELAPLFREPIERQLGLTAEQVVLLPSHTHSGPLLVQTPVPPVQVGEPEARLCQRYVDAALACAEEAISSACPAKLEVAYGASRLGINRRGPGRTPNEHGVRDETVTALIATQQATPARSCVLFAYGCHPTTRSGYLIGPDFPGPARLYLEEKHEHLTSFFAQGFEGDVRPHNVDERGQWLTHSCFLDRVMVCGQQLGQEVDCVLTEAARAELTGPIRTAMSTASLPLVERLDEAILAAAEARGGIRADWAQRMRQHLATGAALPRSAPLAMHAFTLGRSFGYLGLGGEICSGYAHHLRQRLTGGNGGDKHLLFTALTDDNTASYVPTEQILTEGGYEAEAFMLNGPPAPYAPGIEQCVVDAGTALLNRLWHL